MPRGWESARLDDLVDASRGIAYGVLKPGDRLDNSGIPMLRVTDVRTNAVDTSGIYRISPGLHSQFKRTELRGGEIVVSIQGTVGRVARVPDQLIGGNVSRTLAVVPPAVDGLAHWLWVMLLTPQVQEAMRQRTGGSTRDSLNLRDLRLIEVPIAPSSEQRRIVSAIESYFTRLDDATATLERVQRNLERYRASVLKAAVEGRLVPTEAELAREEGRDYEPASVLLERILLERRRRWEEAELAKLRAKGKEPKGDAWKGKYTEPVEPDTSGLPELPEGWCWASLDQCFGILAGVGIPKEVQGEAGLPIPIFKVGEISRAWQAGVRVLTESENTLDEAGALQLSSRLFPENTIVFAKIGAALMLNRRAITGRPCIIDNNVMGLVRSSDELDLAFLFHLLCRVDMGAIARATAVPSIRKTEGAQSRFLASSLR
jgi:type I restriction enzyme S subunit